MKEQWKKFHSDADLLVHVEEGKTLPIKIEFPTLTFASNICCCKSLIYSLRIFVLLGFLVLLAWSSIAIYSNYFLIAKNEPIELSLINEKPLYDNQANKLSIQKELYEFITKDNEGSASNAVDATTKFIKVTLENNHNDDPKTNSFSTVFHLISNDDNINGEDLKSSLPINNVASGSYDKKLLKIRKSEVNNLQGIDEGLKDDIVEVLPIVESINDNTFNSDGEINENLENLDENLLEGAEHLSESATVDIAVNSLLEEILNTVFNDEVSDEHVVSNDNDSEEEKSSSESKYSSGLTDIEDSDDNSSSVNGSENSGENGSVKSSESNSDVDSSYKNDEETAGNFSKEDLQSIEGTNENFDDTSLDNYSRNKDDASDMNTETDDTSKEKIWKFFKINTIDSNENQSRKSEESTSAAKDDGINNNNNSNSNNDNNDNNNDDDADDDVDDDDDDDEYGKSSADEELSSSEDNTNSNDESKYEYGIVNSGDENINSDESGVSDEDTRPISMENVSAEEELHKEIHKMAEKSFPFLAERLVPVVGKHNELLSWYYNNKNNIDFLYENDKLTVFAAKLLYSTDTEEFLIDLNTVIGLITADTYNKNYNDLSSAKDAEIKNYILNRLIKKMDIYNFVVKYLQYKKIASLIMEMFNKAELSSLVDTNEFTINNDFSDLFKEYSSGESNEKIYANEPVTEDYKIVKNERLSLIESMQRIINLNNNITSNYPIKGNEESERSVLRTDLNVDAKPEEINQLNNDNTYKSQNISTKSEETRESNGDNNARDELKGKEGVAVDNKDEGKYRGSSAVSVEENISEYQKGDLTDQMLLLWLMDEQKDNDDYERVINEMENDVYAQYNW